MTAVEWLRSKIKMSERLDIETKNKLFPLLNKALEMEKQQIIVANRDGVDMVVDKKPFITGGQYFEETYREQLKQRK